MEESLAGELRYYAWSLSPHMKELLLPPTADAHYGNPMFSKPHFMRHIKTIKDTHNMFTVLTGDLCESAIKSSKGDLFTQVGTPQDQRDQMIEWLYPIRKKILGMVSGNHEDRIYKDAGVDICKDIAVALGIPYRPEGLLIKISFGSGNEGHPEKPYTYFIYFTHGYGGARTKSSKAVKVERTATWIHADCYIMSHDHVVNAAPDVYLLPDPRTHKEMIGKREFDVGRIKAHRKILVKANAFLKWGGYAERLGFPPSDLDTPVITFSGSGKPRVHVTV